MNNPFSESPLQKLEDALLQKKEITLYIKRDDLIHPLIQGNKWRKLKYNLKKARATGMETLLTYGGAYSNHIYATAAAAKHFNFKAVGIIRGEEPAEKSATLKFAEEQGMQLVYITREKYKQKNLPGNMEKLRLQFGDFYFLPEGGTNMAALKGVAEIIDEINIEYDCVCVPCGTGGTLAGLVAGLQEENHLLGFSSLKGPDTLTADVVQYVYQYCGDEFQNFEIISDYHFGGYAKSTPVLIDFIKDFKQRFDVQLEPVYTGKMFYGLFDLIQKDYFAPGTRIVAIHTGGLQGLSGYPELISTK